MLTIQIPPLAAFRHLNASKENELMQSLNRESEMCRLTLIVLPALFVGIVNSYGQARDALNVFGPPVNRRTAVRFFFNGDNHFHPALIFRVVNRHDVRLNTAPLLNQGRTVYITADEMEKLLRGLQAMTGWKESQQRIKFGDDIWISPVYALVVLVDSSRGSAQAGFYPDKMCQMLRPLDAAFVTPRALWEFQFCREDFKCNIPGFNYQAYPDHYSDVGPKQRPPSLAPSKQPQ
jgi:hypothetical protein